MKVYEVLDEGILDLFSRGSDASGLNNIGNMIGKTQADDITVARKAQELLDQGMPQQEIIRALQQEFGVNPTAARGAISYAEAGLLEMTAGATGAGSIGGAFAGGGNGFVNGGPGTVTRAGTTSNKKKKKSKKA